MLSPLRKARAAARDDEDPAAAAQPAAGADAGAIVVGKLAQQASNVGCEAAEVRGLIGDALARRRASPRR